MAADAAVNGQDRSGRLVLTILCVIGAILPLALTLMRFWAGGGGSDFWSFWQAARAVIEGGSVYGSHIFPYPPHALFLFIPFGMLSFGWGLLFFNFVGIGIFAWAAKPYLPKGFPLVLALCSPAAFFCLFFGQTGLVLSAFWLLAFRGGWAAVAALTFKPHLGILSIFALRSWSDWVRAAALAGFLIAASAVVFGPQIWVDFANAAARHAGLIGVRPRWLVMGVSPAIGYGLWGWAAFGIAAACLLARRVNVFSAATAALLISPYGFHYDMPAASLGFAIAIYCYWERLSVIERAALAAAFLVPVIVTLGTWWVPPILLTALWVQVRLPERADTDIAGARSISPPMPAR